MNKIILRLKNLDFLRRTIGRHSVWSEASRSNISNRHENSLTISHQNHHTTTSPDDDPFRKIRG